MSASYVEQHQMRMPKAIDSFNLYDFRIIEKESSALSITYVPQYMDISMLDGVGRGAGWVNNMGFQEIDIATGDTLFEW